MTRAGEAVAAAVAAADPARPDTLDAAFAAAAEHQPASRPDDVLRALAARGFFRGDDLPRTLKDAAAEQHAGLCRRCFELVPSPIPPLPSPAVLSHGRLAAGGAAVRVDDGVLTRRILLSIPGEPGEVSVEAASLHPRASATLAASAVAGVAAVAVMVWPARWLAPFLVAMIAVAVIGAVYGIARWLGPRRPNAGREAVDAAWRHLVGQVADPATLTAVCRASIGRGSVHDRAKPLRALVERVAEESHPPTEGLQLLAAARVLQVCDGGELGKDRVAGVVAAFAPFLDGELPAAYGEAVVRIAVESGELPAGDRARLRILLLAAMFEARMFPADVRALARTLPHLGDLLGPFEVDAAAQAYAVWRGLPACPTDQAGTATGIFELAAQSPALSRKLLARWPDALFRVLLPEALQKGLGEVVVTPRGLFLDDLLIEDADPTIGIERSPTGSGWYLAIGPHKVPVDRKPPLKVAEALAAWLDYRRRWLLPAAAKPLPAEAARARRLLTPLVVDCPACGTPNIVRVGTVGLPPGG